MAGQSATVRTQKNHREDVAKYFFEAFRVHIAKDVDWKDLAILYKHFEHAEREKFWKTAQTAKEEKVVCDMFDEIQQRIHHEDRFCELVKVLRDCGHGEAASIMDSKIIPKDDKARELIRQKGQLICDKLLVNEILQSLIDKKVVVPQDAKVIEGKHATGNQWAANFELLYRISNENENWFFHFMQSLSQTDQEEIAKLIDKNYFEKCRMVECDERLKKNDTFKKVLAGCRTKLVEDLKEPDRLLDKALQCGLFAYIVIRDIHDIKVKSDKNRAIVEKVRTKGFQGYKLFKECLLFSDQEAVLESLKDKETSILSEVSKYVLKGKDLMEEGQGDMSKTEEVCEDGSFLNNDQNAHMLRKSDSMAGKSGVTSSGPFESITGENMSVSVPSPLQSGQSGCGSDFTLQRSYRNIGHNMSNMSSEESHEQNTSYLNSQSEQTKRYAEGNVKASINRTDNDKTEAVHSSIEGDDDTNTETTSLQNSNIHLSEKLKDKDFVEEGQGDMSKTEEENVGHKKQKLDKEPDDDIKLRDYQDELAALALQGKNVIVVAPTGSGKTHVAFKIIQEHIRQKGRSNAKVIFLVNQVALAYQQGEKCSDLLPYYKSTVLTGESQQKSKGEIPKRVIERCDILIMTAQVLLNSIRDEITEINAFSLLVFDECHHTHDNHVFNQIMEMYMQRKLSDETSADLPQIVGLTASVGVGKATNNERAMTHIKSLMANLDAEVISTVQNNMEELKKYACVPERETYKVQGRENDEFGKEITSLMAKVEARMRMGPVREMPDFEDELIAPSTKGSEQYTQWVSTLKPKIVTLGMDELGSKVKRFLTPLRYHLKCYNNAMIIHSDARVQDALNYLEETMSQKPPENMDQNETFLYKQYQEFKHNAKKEYDPNPKLLQLEELLKAETRGNVEDQRCIVFVKTRNLAEAIVNWMKDTPDLKELNPTYVIGQNQKSAKGMTTSKQTDTLKNFETGEHRLIVATSVAEEGLDISKCNLVIRYDHVTNEIAMVQSRGRVRAKNSTYALLTQSGSGMAEKEELNILRESIMVEAIKNIQECIRQESNSFQEKLHSLQKQACQERQRKTINQRQRFKEGEFQLRCCKCNSLICLSSDVRKIQNCHHVIVDKEIKNRVKFEPAEKKTYGEYQVCGEHTCLSLDCGQKLGPVCKYKEIEFAVVKIDNFSITNQTDEPMHVKRWKKAPFKVSDLSDEELANQSIRVDSNNDITSLEIKLY